MKLLEALLFFVYFTVLFFSLICSCLQILFSLLRTDLARDLKLFTLSLSFSATLLTTESKVDRLGSITLNLAGIEWHPLEMIEFAR